MTFIFTLEYPFHRANYGGGHQITRGLAVQLALLGHQVHVISTGYDEMGISAVDAGVKYHFTGRFYNYLGGLQIVAKSLSLIRRVKPDCVCCMTSEAAIIIPICNLLRVPAIFFLATPETPDFRFHSWKAFKNIRYKLGTFFQYIGASAANRVISLGDFINSQAHRTGGYHSVS